MVKVVENLHNGIGSSEIGVLFSPYVSKAFDSIDHKLHAKILRKNSELVAQFHDVPLNICVIDLKGSNGTKTYLKNRKLYVEFRKVL